MYMKFTHVCISVKLIKSIVSMRCFLGNGIVTVSLLYMYVGIDLILCVDRWVGLFSQFINLPEFQFWNFLTLIPNKRMENANANVNWGVHWQQMCGAHIPSHIFDKWTDHDKWSTTSPPSRVEIARTHTFQRWLFVFISRTILWANNWCVCVWLRWDGFTCSEINIVRTNKPQNSFPDKWKFAVNLKCLHKYGMQ